MVAETCIICPVLQGASGDGLINEDSPFSIGVISGYDNCIPYGALVIIVRFDLLIPHLVADKLDIEAARHGVDGGGATPYTIAVLPSHPVRDTFVRACNTALTHRIVCVKHEHEHVATSEV
jgi:hypothetical protein